MTISYLGLFKKENLEYSFSKKHNRFIIKCAFLTFLLTNSIDFIDSYFLIKSSKEYSDFYRLKSLGLFGIATEDLVTEFIIYNIMALFLWLPLKISSRKEGKTQRYKYSFILCIVLIFSIFDLLLLFGSIIIRLNDFHVLLYGVLLFAYSFSMFFLLANLFEMRSLSTKIINFILFFISMCIICVIL